MSPQAGQVTLLPSSVTMQPNTRRESPQVPGGLIPSTQSKDFYHACSINLKTFLISGELFFGSVLADKSEISLLHLPSVEDDAAF